MSICKKLAKYLNTNRGEYDYLKIERFLTRCCGLFFRQGKKGSHIIFYWDTENQYDVSSQFTVSVHNGRVKKVYVKKMWEVLAENLGILVEDFYNE